jgi:hypothetical protein
MSSQALEHIIEEVKTLTPEERRQLLAHLVRDRFGQIDEVPHQAFQYPTSLDLKRPMRLWQRDTCTLRIPPSNDLALPRMCLAMRIPTMEF